LLQGEKMFFAFMLICSPLNLVHHEKECFGLEDTKGYYLTEEKCLKRVKEMENELLYIFNYPALVSKNCIKVNLKSA